LASSAEELASQAQELNDLISFLTWVWHKKAVTKKRLTSKFDKPSAQNIKESVSEHRENPSLQ
jgi:hypothetical protein